MRIHLVSLPHTRVDPAFCGCAYTSKVLKFCKMMGLLEWHPALFHGLPVAKRPPHPYEIFLYAPEGPPVLEATLVPCLSEKTRVAIFGEDDPKRLPEWPSNAKAAIFNEAVVQAMHYHFKPQDLILLSGGATHQPIRDAFPAALIAEPFVGYEGILNETHCAFESYAHMQTVYRKKGIENIRWFDRVIPPFCDPDDFFPAVANHAGDYLLFVGRLIQRKGPQIALEIADRSGLPLRIAGAGGVQLPDMTLKGLDVTLKGDLEYLGPVDVAQRADLMAGARAVICPTIYSEPGGNVAIEANMAGTPVITMDFGCFSETISHGVSGFHFRLLRDGVKAVEECEGLDRQRIREIALRRYSLAAVAPKFQQWFSDLSTLFDQGWYTE